MHERTVVTARDAWCLEGSYVPQAAATQKLESKVKLMQHHCSKSIPEFIKLSVYQGTIVHQTVQLTAKHERHNDLLYQHQARSSGCMQIANFGFAPEL